MALNSTLPPMLPPPTRPLRNVTCPYCGCDLKDGSTSKEHVVGRKFVPSGAFDVSWNLILRACEPCNNRKSDLEDEISAVSLLRREAATGPRDSAYSEAVRKAARSRSRTTKKLVGASAEEFSLKMRPWPAVVATVHVVAPPQLDVQRAYELAVMQVSAFLYLLTYDEETHRGRRWSGSYLTINFAFQADRGNSYQRWFMQKVRPWQPRLAGWLAAGFYRIAIRRDASLSAWSWALEWNRAIRVLGFSGDEACLREVTADTPRLASHTMRDSPTKAWRVRLDSRLPPEEDTMFDDPFEIMVATTPFGVDPNGS